MDKKNDLIYDASVQFEQLTGLLTEVHSQRQEYDAILSIENQQFTVEAKAEVRSSNKGLVLSELNHLANRGRRPVVLIAKYIAVEIAKELKEKGYNYIDLSGNAYIKGKPLFVYISGQKIKKIPQKNQSRAFQETGIKLIFNLLRSPENLQLSYRELSVLSGISVGSVSYVMNELEDLHFILKTNTNRVLKNTNKLLERWIVAYNDVLRPRIVKKRMRFKMENYMNWSELSLYDNENINLWAGEPAAALLTNRLQPEKYTIYTNGSWQSIAKRLRLIPDENGDVEILHIFWQEDTYTEKRTVPKLLIYADLISSGYERNIEIAKELYYNDLQNFKR
jgi:hypothetical protein